MQKVRIGLDDEVGFSFTLFPHKFPDITFASLSGARAGSTIHVSLDDQPRDVIRLSCPQHIPHHINKA